MKQLLYIVAAFLAGFITNAILLTGRSSPEPSTRTVTVYDTIPYHYAVPKDSVVLRYETHYLPLYLPQSAIRRDTVTVTDSVEVVVPITRKEYSDSTYRLWISGYAATLDSIHTYTRHDYTTTTLSPIKPKHWHFGMTTGVAMTTKGVQPYVGVGITYSFKSF